MDATKLKSEVSLDMKIGELCITENRELIFKQKESDLNGINHKTAMAKALKEFDDSYVQVQSNTNKYAFDVNKIKSDMLSAASGMSYYVSVQTPKTKSRSVISSRIRVGSRHRKAQQWSLFKKSNNHR